MFKKGGDKIQLVASRSSNVFDLLGNSFSLYANGSFFMLDLGGFFF